MRIVVVILAFTIWSSIFPAQQRPLVPMAPVSTHPAMPYPALSSTISPIHFHVNMHQAQAGIKNSVETAVEQTNLQTVEQNQTSIINNVMHYMDSARTKSWELWANYKYWIVGSCAAALYGYVCYTIYRGNRFVEKQELWSSWKSDVALDTLLSIPQKDLAQDLVHEIQRRYTNPRNPTDFVSPLAAFLTEIEQERRDIEYYATFNLWVKRVYVSKLVPLSTSSFENAEKRLTRLAYLKNAFLTWAADFRLAQNKNGAKEAIG